VFFFFKELTFYYEFMSKYINFLDNDPLYKEK